MQNAEVVHKRVVKFLETPLKQRGHEPPLGMSADKDAFKKICGQFHSCMTVVQWPLLVII